MFFRKSNSGNDKIFAGDQLSSSMSTKHGSQRLDVNKTRVTAIGCQQNTGHSDWMSTKHGSQRLHAAKNKERKKYL